MGNCAVELIVNETGETAAGGDPESATARAAAASKMAWSLRTVEQPATTSAVLNSTSHCGVMR